MYACLDLSTYVLKFSLVTGQKTQIHIDSSGSYYEVSKENAGNINTGSRKLETAQISLNDCLACRSVYQARVVTSFSVLIALLLQWLYNVRRIRFDHDAVARGGPHCPFIQSSRDMR